MPTRRRPPAPPPPPAPAAPPTPATPALVFTGAELPPGQPLPAALRPAGARGEAVTAPVDPLLAGLRVDRSYRLDANRRSASGAEAAAPVQPAPGDLLALETADGETLFMRADALAEVVARRQTDAAPGAATVDLSALVARDGAARGFGDMLWKLVSVLRLPQDGLREAAEKLAKEWAKERLKELPGKALEDGAYQAASFLGAKALMWKIESQLAGRPGLYQWVGERPTVADFCQKDDPRLAPMSQGQPALLLIHGTASYTGGAFGDLQANADGWEALKQRFPGGIFGFEHRTFSESPVENALALLEALPRNARLSLVTHSRGGLVGDLLCLGAISDAAIDQYEFVLPQKSHGADEAGLRQEAALERERLRRLRELLMEKRPRVERYVRVASPSRGTRLLSDNLDAALSDLLGLVKIGGSALMRLAVGAIGGPVAGVTAGRAASSALGVLQRLVLEIADLRIHPLHVPGIAAMRVDAPVALLIERCERRPEVAMAVIAGDTEFHGLGLNRLGWRIANLFCDWRLFDDHDNDLVVDTDSMYAGLAGQAGARYFYDRGEEVSHFGYFENVQSREALKQWLTTNDPATAANFSPLDGRPRKPWEQRERGMRQRGGGASERPVVIVLPGVMGSHLAKKTSSGKPIRLWLDPLMMGFGGLGKLADLKDERVVAEDLFESAYGDLVEHLGQTHEVLRCPYDWRQPLTRAAEALALAIDKAENEHPKQPIRLLAHSMGGLVARTLMKHRPEAWKKVVDSGGRLVMLGTPNKGSHAMVHALLGKDSAVRQLATLDLRRNLQEVLDIVARFPGALSLLPSPRFTGLEAPGDLLAAQFYDPQTWSDLANAVTDTWFGGNVCGQPLAAVLRIAENHWDQLHPAGGDFLLNPERVVYVYGQGKATPCGVRATASSGLQMLFTREGDGTVPWQSGRIEELENRKQTWYMPVPHGDMADEPQHFGAITELLETGRTDRLGRLPAQRSEAAGRFVLEAAPPMRASPEALARSLLGASRGTVRPPPRHKATLRVSVRADDLRFVDQPVLCGHYLGDAISGAEAELDRKLDHRLSERARLGRYAGAAGSSAVVLQRPNDQQQARKSLYGAVIVGLGEFNGQTSARLITESVRAGVMDFLMQLRESLERPAETPIRLYSLLIGWSSNANIDVSESVTAVTLGVLEANRQFRHTDDSAVDQTRVVEELCFVEIYRDAAITAAHEVLQLPRRLESELDRLGATLEPATSLQDGDGVIQRLNIHSDQGHWARFIVTDDDAPNGSSDPARWDSRAAEAIRQAWERQKREQNTPTHAQGADASPVESRYFPQRLRYLYLSRRARAESVVLQRQPHLVEDLIRQQRHHVSYDAQLGNTLFQLMVPLDFKGTFRDSSRLLLVVDAFTASLPWEMMQVDKLALALRTPLVRQLNTSSFRRGVAATSEASACVIANPKTTGFGRRFERQGNDPVDRELNNLPGAEREGEAIFQTLREAGWKVNQVPPGTPALGVFNALYERPHKILVISAHGVFEAQGRDGQTYTGAVLSDGLLITAAEVAQMETVPDLVFLSCCHLGSVNAPYSAPNRLAQSLAQELIEMGVRCVVAAGWEVNDDAACTFASDFFGRMADGAPFGEALFDARKATHQEHPETNTWGAYQAYGDPGYRLTPPGKGPTKELPDRLVSVDELIQRLARRRNARTHGSSDLPKTVAAEQAWVQTLLQRCPAEWAQRPDVLQALGTLYADMGPEGFETACEALTHAIRQQDKLGRVAVKAIELLANLEARRGSRLGDEGKHSQGLAQINRAITRMEALNATVSGQPGADPFPNGERAAILGSALKRKAVIIARQRGGKAWSQLQKLASEAAKAYSRGIPDDRWEANTYNATSALPMAWLAGTLSKLVPANWSKRMDELLDQCAKNAREAYEREPSFWSATNGVDPELVRCLMLKPPTTSQEAQEQAGKLLKDYEDAIRSVPRSERQNDSLKQQWQSLARLLEARGNPGDNVLVEMLDTLSKRFSEGIAPQTT